MKDDVTVIPNHRNNLFLARPVSDLEKVCDISLDPIIAWRVCVEECPRDGFSISIALPIGCHLKEYSNDVDDLYVIYDTSNESYEVVGHMSGYGKDNLIEYFQDLENLNKRLYQEKSKDDGK